jgi:hypothetical protein
LLLPLHTVYQHLHRHSSELSAVLLLTYWQHINISMSTQCPPSEPRY